MADAKTKAAALAVASSVSLGAFVAHWEGQKFVPYRDIVGVWTVCAGVTGSAVIPGKVYSRQECRDLNNGALRSHALGLAACLNTTPPEHVLAAAVSWTYNVGVGAACASTMVRLMNQSQWADACRQLPRWNMAGGKVVQGLSNRRAAELDLCLNGWPA